MLNIDTVFFFYATFFLITDFFFHFLKDEVDNVNVSLLKKVVRDSRSVWINNSKIWTAKAYDKEYIGIENGEQVHKCSRKANSYDLIRYTHSI